jgi:hypothetical protein
MGNGHPSIPLSPFPLQFAPIGGLLVLVEKEE